MMNEWFSLLKEANKELNLSDSLFPITTVLIFPLLFIGISTFLAKTKVVSFFFH